MNVTFPDELIGQIADAVADQLANRKIKESRTPYTVAGFAKKSNMHPATVRRHIESGQLRKVDGISKILIPASELDRFQ